MNTEEMIKALAQGGITVQGDFVVEKKVEYEVNNVEAGGIGIQVVNGKEDLSEKKEEISGKPRPDNSQKKSAPGPRKQFLFIEGDASWEKEGKRRSPSKENKVVRRNERDRFLKYLKAHCLSNRELTCTQGDTLNNVVASFLVEWQHRGLIAEDFAGPAVWRFLTEECEMKSTVTAKAYGKEIKEWVRGNLFQKETLRMIKSYFS